MISVIIPTYNTSGGLVKSVDSVLNQTYSEVEIVVVDDNDPSSVARKRTEELMQKYKTCSNVYYIKHEKNMNGAVARNTGIRHSKGEYIAFLDDDDVFLPTKLEKQLLFLEHNLEYQAVYCRIFSGGKIINAYPYEGNCLIPLLKERTRMFTSTLLFRRDALLSFGGFNENFRRHQDYDLMIKFFVQGYKVGLIKEPLIQYTTTGANRVSGRQFESLKAQYLKQFDDVLNLLEKEKPGIKRNIIANNYASVFVSNLVGGNLKESLRVLAKYFFVSPAGFLSFLFNFLKNHIVIYR